ncbi:MAG: hypothetical protein ACKVQJ_08345 [Pyrinomonadaceae bacterium]
MIGEEDPEESYLYRGDERVNYFTATDRVFDDLESTMRLIISEFAVNRVFIHAGVVGWKDRALIFPGRSHSGKSTLIRELVGSGATYYSDEFAVLSAGGFVHPFPKNLSVREEWARGWQVNYPIEAFGGIQGTKPIRPEKFILTSYRENGSTTISELTLGNGILELLKHTTTTRQSPALTLRFLRNATADARIFVAERGEANKFVEAILDQANLDNPDEDDKILR